MGNLTVANHGGARMTSNYARWLAGLLVTVVAIPEVHAQEVPDALRACAAEKDDGARLACYDREMARALAAVPTSATTKPLVATLSPEERFGFRGELAREVEERAKEGSPDLERLVSKISALSRKPTGELVMTLENGQVWIERAGTSAGVKVGDSVSIRPASLGSFLMTGPSGRAARVSRIR
jgi:hypothetical protein